LATASGPAAAAAVPVFAESRAPVAVPPAVVRSAASAVSLAPPATPGERLARCTEILQKASLEPISAAETEFFKKECR
jgi:hypothetical protein